MPKQELLAVSPCIESGAASDSVIDSTVLTLEALLHLLINETTRRRFLTSGVVDAILPMLKLESLHGPRTINIKIATLSMIAYALISIDCDVDDILEQVNFYSPDFMAAHALSPAFHVLDMALDQFKLPHDATIYRKHRWISRIPSVLVAFYREL